MTSMRWMLLPCLALALIGAAPAGTPAEPAIVRVRLVTPAGPIMLALDVRHAPGTAVNFLRYVDDGRLDGTDFYRASRRVSAPTTGFVQGGIGTDAHRSLGFFPLEPTSRTGLHHVSGAISMARYARTESATGNFSIMIGDNLSMDARPGSPGYAVFGRVVSGMDVVKRMLALPTRPGGDGAFKGQMMTRPVPIIRAERLDGTPKPTGGLKVWQLLKGVRR